MLPRFTLLDTGGFEEDLRRGEDSRFWVKLGLRDTKIIGLGAKLTVRRMSSGSLSATLMPPSLQFLIRARTVADLLGDQRGWPLAARTFAGLLNSVLQPDEAQLPELPESGTSSVLAAIALLGPGTHRDASPLPLLAYFRHLTMGALRLDGTMGRTKTAFLERLHAAIQAAARKAAPLTRSDILFWAVETAVRRGEARFNSFCWHVARISEHDPSALSAADELLRSPSAIPTKRATRAYLRLRRRGVPKSIAGCWPAAGRAEPGATLRRRRRR
jgi:hypothetical protein